MYLHLCVHTNNTRFNLSSRKEYDTALHDVSVTSKENIELPISDLHKNFIELCFGWMLVLSLYNKEDNLFIHLFIYHNKEDYCQQRTLTPPYTWIIYSLY